MDRAQRCHRAGHPATPTPAPGPHPDRARSHRGPGAARRQHARRVVNPRQVRDFAKATGRLAKTDALDAQVLAHFAAAVQPPPRPLPDTQTADLVAVLARRRPVVKRHTAEQNRLPRATGARVRRRIQVHGRWLERALARVDADLEQALPALAGAGRLAAQCAWCGEGAAAHPAGGAAGARHVVAPAGGAVGRSGAAEPGQWHLPRAAGHVLGPGRGAGAGTLSRQQVAPLVGGRWGGRGRGAGGPVHNPPLRRFYHRLCAAGKAKKVALVAGMRKLLTMLNAMLRDQTPWPPPAVATA